MPTRAAAAEAVDATTIIRDICLRSGAGVPDELVMEHNAALTASLALVKSVDSRLIVGSTSHKNTNPKAERANGVASDEQRAYANGHKDDWDSRLTLGEFASSGIHSATSTLHAGLTPFFFGCRADQRLPLSPPRDDRTAGSGALRAADAADGDDCAGAARGGAGGAEGEARRGQHRHGVQVGERVLVWTKELLNAADIGKPRSQ